MNECSIVRLILLSFPGVLLPTHPTRIVLHAPPYKGLSLIKNIYTLAGYGVQEDLLFGQELGISLAFHCMEGLDLPGQ